MLLKSTNHTLNFCGQLWAVSAGWMLQKDWLGLKSGTGSRNMEKKFLKEKTSQSIRFLLRSINTSISSGRIFPRSGQKTSQSTPTKSKENNSQLYLRPNKPNFKPERFLNHHRGTTLPEIWFPITENQQKSLFSINLQEKIPPHQSTSKNRKLHPILIPKKISPNQINKSKTR